MFMVPDAVSGLTAVIFTSINPLLPLWYVTVWGFAYKQNTSLYKSLELLTKSSNMSAYGMIPHSDIAPERHSTAVPAPNK